MIDIQTPTVDVSPARVASDIAHALRESAPHATLPILRAVRVLGAGHVYDVAARALFIEATGGLLLPEPWHRRRTPGGVFFLLLKDSLDAAQHLDVFGYPPRTSNPHPRQPQAQPSPVDLAEIPNTTGEVRTVKITLIGRPGRLIQKAGYVLTTMTSTKVPALPAGLPTPPNAPTVYTVYISAKQWAKVAAALRSPDDVLIAEGTPVYDAELEGMAVYVTNATTKLLQQAVRAKQAATVPA